jgi:hypothetical protein
MIRHGFLRGILSGGGVLADWLLSVGAAQS